MIIRKCERKMEQIAKTGFVWDYKLPDEGIGIAVQKLNGRVPDSGQLMNTVCNEICYVISGSGIVFIEDEKYEVGEGDIFTIDAGQKSYIIAKDLHFVAVTSPDWYPEQCETVDE